MKKCKNFHERNLNMEGWKDGRMEGWKDGRMGGWKDGRGILLLNLNNEMMERWKMDGNSLNLQA